MVLIDSSVWVGLFRRHSPARLLALERAIDDDAATCGIVLQEVLQGIQPVRYARVVRDSLLRHHYLEASQAVHLKAAGYVRACRARGLAFSTVDALIAAIAAHHSAVLWTLDKDFMRAARLLPLRLRSEFF